MTKFIRIAFLIFAFSKSCWSECNVCTEYNLMCVGSNQFQYCIQSTGEPISQPITCTENLICSTLVNPSNPCVNATNSTFITPDCTCGYCLNEFFACVSDTQFRVCFDLYDVSGPVIDCPSNTKCDAQMQSGTYCAADVDTNCPLQEVTTIPPTTTTITTTTQRTIPTAITTTRLPPGSDRCTQEGRFPVANSMCKEYYTCIFINGNWITSSGRCSGNANFDPAAQRCSLLYACAR